jgi:predicted TIM-barrel fold metal-dependent hydrolase
MPVGFGPVNGLELPCTWPRSLAAGEPPPRSIFPHRRISNTATISCFNSSDRIRCYAVVNPNFQQHAVRELKRCLDAGMVGIKLAASRRADDPLLDPICRFAEDRGVPVLHHIWQHRRRDYPGQEASDAVELGRLAARHPHVNFLLAHIGGGGDWIHSLKAVQHLPNVFVDLSGSGVDGGMLETCLEQVGCERLLWGCDLTIDTGWAKLRYLEQILSPPELELVKWRNAGRIFPPAALPND